MTKRAPADTAVWLAVAGWDRDRTPYLMRLSKEMSAPSASCLSIAALR